VRARACVRACLSVCVVRARARACVFIYISVFICMHVDHTHHLPFSFQALGRENTAEEEAWLADYDNLPGWARSQLKKP